MDLITPLLTDPASPRLTTYIGSTRMELSGATLANWQAKVANLLRALGVADGDSIAIDARADWQPATIAIGGWRIGARVIDGRTATPDSIEISRGAPLPRILFTDSAERADSFSASPLGADVEETFLLSRDPFGRGIEESGGDLPFGINDFSPELRVYPDAFLGPEPAQPSPDIARLSHAADELHLPAGARVLLPRWDSVDGLCQCLSPLFVGGSVVICDDATPARIQQLVASERITMTVLEP